MGSNETLEQLAAFVINNAKMFPFLASRENIETPEQNTMFELQRGIAKAVNLSDRKRGNKYHYTLKRLIDSYNKNHQS